MKSNSYKLATAHNVSCSVRFEERAREFICVARLKNEAEAKAKCPQGASPRDAVRSPQVIGGIPEAGRSMRG